MPSAVKTSLVHLEEGPDIFLPQDLRRKLTRRQRVELSDKGGKIIVSHRRGSFTLSLRGNFQVRLQLRKIKGVILADAYPIS